MTKNLATILKNRIASLPFIDVLAGLVQTVEIEDMTDGTLSKKVIRKLPVSYDTQGADNCTGREKDLQPDSSKKSIIYFEDFGTTAGPSIHGVPSYVSRVRLIAWLNRKRLVGDSYAEISGQCIASTIGKLVPKNPINIDMFTRLTVKAKAIPVQDERLFANYTYDQKVRQYLRPPFEVFGIDLECTYTVNPNCLADIDFTIENNC